MLRCLRYGGTSQECFLGGVLTTAPLEYEDLLPVLLLWTSRHFGIYIYISLSLSLCAGPVLFFQKGVAQPYSLRTFKNSSEEELASCLLDLWLFRMHGTLSLQLLRW